MPTGRKGQAMAYYFQLTRLGSRSPSTFQSIDNAICQHTGLPWDDHRYCCGWYDIIGFSLASGKSFAEITDYLREKADNPEWPEWQEGYRNLLRINHFLMENYTTDAWYGR